jgi:hypothetical protein
MVGNMFLKKIKKKFKKKIEKKFKTKLQFFSENFKTTTLKNRSSENVSNV